MFENIVFVNCCIWRFDFFVKKVKLNYKCNKFLFLRYIMYLYNFKFDYKFNN